LRKRDWQRNLRLRRSSEGEQTKEELVCALLTGEAETEEKAESIAKTYGSCPYVSSMATKKNKLFATFLLPEKQRWWIEYVGRNTRETFGLKKAEVTIADKIQYPKEPEQALSKILRKISPCGANCGNCPAYEKCLGCPATVFHKRSPCEE
jgi:hypothetical protein